MERGSITGYEVLGDKYDEGSRVVTDTIYAREVRRNIENEVLAAGDDGTVVIDMSKVDDITVKCAAEMFGKLRRNLGEGEYDRRIRVKRANAYVDFSIREGIRRIAKYWSDLGMKGMDASDITAGDAMSMLMGKVREKNLAHIRLANRRIAEAARDMKTFVVIEFYDAVDTEALAAYYEYMGFEVCRFTSVLRDESSIRVEWCKRKIGE